MNETLDAFAEKLESTSQHPFGLWLEWTDCRQAITARVGPSTDLAAELRWVAEELAGCLPLVFQPLALAADSLEAGSGESLDMEREAGLRRSPPPLPLPWLAGSDGQSLWPWEPTLVFLASCSRSDPLVEEAERLVRRFPRARVLVVLGEWWVGHRRTWRLPAAVTTVYWYELHDRLLPLFLDPPLPAGGLRDLSNAAVAAVDGQVSTRTALVVSDQPEARRLWMDILPSYGFHVFASRHVDEIPAGHCDLLICDPSVDPSPMEIAKLRQVYPAARLLACFGFPRWHRVAACLDAGADLISAKPFHLEGLVRSFSSAALPRR
jgi:CheY-like chemotaxis protein